LILILILIRILIAGPPGKVAALAGIQMKSVCWGGGAVGAVTIDGHAYTWGEGLFGQLGHGTIEDYAIPRLVKDLEDA